MERVSASRVHQTTRTFCDKRYQAIVIPARRLKAAALSIQRLCFHLQSLLYPIVSTFCIGEVSPRWYHTEPENLGQAFQENGDFWRVQFGPRLISRQNCFFIDMKKNFRHLFIILEVTIPFMMLQTYIPRRIRDSGRISNFSQWEKNLKKKNQPYPRKLCDRK